MRQTELILALDVPSRAAALPLLQRLQGSLGWVKIGLQMFTALGPEWTREVAGLGFKIFLDLKLHDIPNTVAKAVESVAALPVGMLTLHASGGSEMLRAALAAQQNTRPEMRLLGVTVLTSMDDAQLASLGIAPPQAAVQVERLARLATGAGLRGLVCSPLEIAALRRFLPAETRLVTPGIRGANDPAGDQKRTLSPRQAADAGADFIVVGRPILQAPDPAVAARQIQAALAD